MSMTTKEASIVAGCNPTTINKLIQLGKFGVVSKVPGQKGQLRYDIRQTPEEIKRIVQENAPRIGFKAPRRSATPLVIKDRLHSIPEVAKMIGRSDKTISGWVTRHPDEPVMTGPTGKLLPRQTVEKIVAYYAPPEEPKPQPKNFYDLLTTLPPTPDQIVSELKALREDVAEIKTMIRELHAVWK